MNSIITWVIKVLSGVNSAEWKAVLDFVLLAASKELTNESKRAWVLDKLQNLGLKGSTANFLIEAALKFLKRTGRIEA